MNCVKVLCLLAVLATSCGSGTDSDIYPIMGLQIQRGENRIRDLEFLDATLAKLANKTAGDINYKVVNVSLVLGQFVSAKKLTYKVELTQNNVTKLCNARIWHQPWLGAGGTDFKLYCESEETTIESIF